MTYKDNYYSSRGTKHTYKEDNEIYKTCKTYKPPELLAPAGNFDALKAAVENGADAVYLGGKLFNARQYAGNFDNDELKKAIDFSHVRGVKIYLTLNTLISDTEIKEALVFAGQAYNLGIDGIIVQDLGLARLIRESVPGLDLHASTQMTIYNSEGINILGEMGFKRVVLAREVPLDEIGSITKYCPQNKNTEIEIFVHGALCISYSGQCLMSSIIGGRSGNRGRCAQPCRLPYQLVNRIDRNNLDERNKEGYDSRYDFGYDFKTCGDKSYIMSPKDICTINDLEEIIKAGVKSLKIEGRMKSPEYVAIVVGIYRKYLDKAVENLNLPVCKTYATKEDMGKLHQIFNRGGFSKGYLYGKTGADMICFEKPKNWGVYIGNIISYDKSAKMVKVKLEENLAIGDGIEIWNKGDGESPGTVVSEIIKNKTNVKEADAGDIVLIGRVNGKIGQGNRIYKTSSKKLMEEARATWTQGFGKRVLISGELYIRQGEAPLLKVKDNDDNEIDVIGEFIIEKAINVGITEERAREQINKTGGTPFKFEKLTIFLDEDVALPIKELNNLRRKALEELEVKRISMFKSRKNPVNIDILQGKDSINYDHEYNEKDNNENNGYNDYNGSNEYNEHNNYNDCNKYNKLFDTQEKKPKLSLLFYNIDDERLNRLIEINQSLGLNLDRIYLPFNFFLGHVDKNMSKNTGNNTNKNTSKNTDKNAGNNTKVTQERRLLQDIINLNESNRQTNRQTNRQGEDSNKQGKSTKTEIFVWLPSITRGNYDSLIKRYLPGIIEMGIDGILSGNIGTLEYIRHLSPDIKLACDYSYNIFNSYTAETLYNLNADSLTLSYELTLEQIKNISRVLEQKGIKKDKEIVVYGRIPLMITEYCPVDAINVTAINDESFINRGSGRAYYRDSCNRNISDIRNINNNSYINDNSNLNDKRATCTTCLSRSCTKGVYFLQDRMKERFPLYHDRIDCRTTIFNSKVLFMADNMSQVIRSGADILRLNILDESINDVVKLIKMHQDLLKGNYDYELKKYEDDINAIKNKGFTRGHYFRGV